MQINIVKEYFKTADTAISSEVEITDLEKRLNLTIPQFTKEYLQLYGGAITLKKPFIRCLKSGVYLYTHLYGLGSIESSVKNLKEIEEEISGFESDAFFPFGAAEVGMLCIGLKGEYLNKIYVLFPEDYDGHEISSMMELIANSFAEMLAQGITEEEYIEIIDGQDSK